MWSVLKLALRAAIWRSTSPPPFAGLGALVGWAFVLGAARLGTQLLAAAPTVEFNPYGLNALVAWLAVALAVAAFFVAPPARTTVLAGMVAFSVLTEIVVTGLGIGLSRIPPIATPDAIRALAPWLAAHLPEAYLQQVPAMGLFAVTVVYWIGGMSAIVRSFEPGRLRVLGKVVALWAALFLAKAAIPHAPTFVGPGFDVPNANWWEWARAQQASRVAEQSDPDIAAAELRVAQGNLMRAALARVAPHRRGETDVYALALAGWSEQDVFRKEIEGALGALARSLPLEGHVIRLINNPATVGAEPLATRRNFATAVRALAQVMDKDEDVLLLLMTSHGAEQGIALQLPGGGGAMLTPTDVKGVLDGAGIKNRVVIVSACYGGVFVPLLAGDDSIVLTAADARNTSFGCASDRDWTYFGDALFKQSLQPGADFKQAFDRARILIQGWERLDRIPPSNPQGHFGPALVARLEPLFRK